MVETGRNIWREAQETYGVVKWDVGINIPFKLGIKLHPEVGTNTWGACPHIAENLTVTWQNFHALRYLGFGDCVGKWERFDPFDVSTHCRFEP